MNKIKSLLLGLFMVAAGVANAATLLPPGEVTFFDGSGHPISGGRVYFYTPNTSTPKPTWQDSGQSRLNPNPVLLDSAGRGVIYGSGTYRQVVKDTYGNTIWDQFTSDGSANSANWAGTSVGTANAQTLTSSSFSQADGQTILFRAGVTNTGPLTISANGIGAVPVDQDTLKGPVSLSGYEVTTGNVYSIVYDASLGVFHLGNHPATQPFLSLAASGTTDVGSVASRNATITGAATITSFGGSASIGNPVYNLKFTGASTITYNPVSLITPGGANITTANGDFAVAVYLGSSNWQIAAYVPASGVTPPGEVAFFFLATCPSGWLPANGSNGTAEMRGYFVRGLDTSGAIDPGRVLGSGQADALQNHTHSYNATGNQNSSLVNNGSSFAVNLGFVATNTGGPSGNVASETRPKNVALLACQKS